MNRFAIAFLILISLGSIAFYSARLNHPVSQPSVQKKLSDNPPVLKSAEKLEVVEVVVSQPLSQTQDRQNTANKSVKKEQPTETTASAESGAIELNNNSSSQIETITKASQDIFTENIPVTISAPPESAGALNSKDILDIVNAERKMYGLRSLSYNGTLSKIADIKTWDMISKQYFEHVSPDGVDVSGLAGKYQYDYLSVGENLAMGDFTSSADVMNGWMNSPGHRANILNPEYTEIGISAQQGMHDGRLMWYAVQEFGRPASLCPKPDELLSKKITVFETQISTLEVTLKHLKAEIESNQSNRTEYEKNVKDYNSIVALYNNAIELTKEAVQTYNASAKAYNLCIGT